MANVMHTHTHTHVTRCKAASILSKGLATWWFKCKIRKNSCLRIQEDALIETKPAHYWLFGSTATLPTMTLKNVVFGSETCVSRLASMRCNLSSYYTMIILPYFFSSWKAYHNYCCPWHFDWTEDIYIFFCNFVLWSSILHHFEVWTWVSCIILLYFSIFLDIL